MGGLKRDMWEFFEQPTQFLMGNVDGQLDRIWNYHEMRRKDSRHSSVALF